MLVMESPPQSPLTSEAIDGGPIECPTCDVGWLEVCQPNYDDVSQLIGYCTECGRLALVVYDGNASEAIPIPSVDQLRVALSA